MLNLPWAMVVSSIQNKKALLRDCYYVEKNDDENDEKKTTTKERNELKNKININEHKKKNMYPLYLNFWTWVIQALQVLQRKGI